MPEASANLAVALALATHELPIIPCKQSKQPLIEGWQQAATTDPTTIEYWYRQWPSALPGIALGPAGLVVPDADRGHGDGSVDGVANLKALAAQHGGFPPAPMTRTPRGGYHIVFKQPTDGEPLGNGRGCLPEGVDCRGNGGLVIAPGAVARDGRSWTPVKGKPELGLAYLNNMVPI